MRQTVKLFLVSLFLTFSFSAFASAQEKDILAEANQLFTERKYAEAEQAYQNLLRQKIDEPTRAKIIFNLGLTYKQLKQYDKAVETFNRIFVMAVDDREAGGSIMQAYRNYRPSAQWEIGKIRFAKGDYEGAYTAFRTTEEKYPFQSWCGTCLAGYMHDYAMYQGISLEYLGRHREAVNVYWRIYDPRIAELYYGAGQLDDLKAILDKNEEAIISEGMRKYAWTRAKASEYLPTHALRQALEIYDLEKAGDWSGLLKAAVQPTQFRRGGRGNAAVEILARHPKEVLPLIKQGMSLANSRTTPFNLYYEILGLAATDETVGYLKDLAAREQNWWQVAAMVKALSLAGEKGESAIRELEPNAAGNLKLAIERHKKGELDEPESEIKFPVLKVKEKLPLDLQMGKNSYY